ncbi:TPA: hypothetical protein KT423_000993 [Enterococcus faecium]|nr:hypothetical protein [Enterococcus faecium]
MKEISANEAHIPQKNQVGIYKVLHGEGIYKIQLLTGYNNGANGKWLKAKSIRELKTEVEKIRLGLTREEISRLSKNSSFVIQKEKEKHLLHRELIIEKYYDVDLPDQLRIIDEFSEKKWKSEIYPSLIQYKASGKPMYNYTGFLNYTQYKYAFRKLKGIKQADIALYEMKKMDRLKLIQELVQNTWNQAIVELEKENGKILTNEYLIVNEIEELIGLFSCENGEVFLKSSPIYSILDSPYQFIQVRR